LLANKGTSVVVAGHRQPQAVHVIAHALNAALANLGKTVVLHPTPASNYGSIADLQHSVNEGEVNTLIIAGGNPAYNAPADLDFAGAVQKSRINVVRLGYYEDETFPICSWHIPAAHFLESWGDARTSDGTWVPIQPLIEPLFGGMTDLEFLSRVGGLEQTRPHDIVQATLKPIAGFDDFDNKWRKFLHDGFLANSAAKPALAGFDYNKATRVLGVLVAPTKLSKDNLELAFHRDYSLDDGRYNNNGWLQELPDPITKITWDNAVLVSRKTAEELGWKNSDLVEIEVPLGVDKPKAKVQGAVWIQPGLADYTLGLALGYGRRKAGGDQTGGTGRVGHEVGLYNAYAIRTAVAPHYYAAGCKVAKTGGKFKFSLTQDHGSMEGRPILREANLDDYKRHPEFAKNFDLESPGHSAHIAKDANNRPLGIYKHPYTQYEEKKAKGEASGPIMKSDVHQWGMSIDLSTCVGCSACMMACQSENNIPIVGKRQVGKGREMHWIRLDRYYSGAYDKAPSNLIDDPQIVTQPMLCQHCENAPCESVCPVNATVHDEEGLNVMAYNRCVGTRYCSNNCPYKVRRFNFFDYNRRPLNELYKSPIISSTKGEWELKRWFKNPGEGSLPEDQWELIKLIKNPDVSVRMRGVMEKCTFCLQRIEQSKIAQKIKAGASGDVQVPDGTIKTACEQACPAQAIVFGNLLDPNSRVSKLKKQDRDYNVLGFLDTRPRLTYLAKIRNPNPAMPDYTPLPLTLKEYADKNGSPFEEHHSEHGTNAVHGAEKKGEH
jgi:molybdopterin-containing oxidoreductase family iron-sulfur binding subunit